MKKIGIVALISGIGYLLYKLFSNLSIPKVGTSSTTITGSITPTVINTQLSFASVYNNFTRSESSTSGSISAGKSFIKISNIGDAAGTINVGNGNTSLGVGQTWQFPVLLGQIQQLSTVVSFDASGTIFLVETSTPV
ncbi:hypothetical protein [Emticicia sp. BO119]|uniref:hypothetical protein n=1 Tax=Emticicia sp. BO119 TaxID=2757768 RepID=UPI0015F0646E|nr:hypothetical protein [Emticicia sp. BO119]MBA4849498.1 hypothetical protein [Emticicia sp. BO119]